VSTTNTTTAADAKRERPTPRVVLEDIWLVLFLVITLINSCQDMNLLSH